MNDEQYGIQERKDFWADIISVVLWYVFPIIYMNLGVFVITYPSIYLQNIFLVWAISIAITFACFYLFIIKIRLEFE